LSIPFVQVESVILLRHADFVNQNARNATACVPESARSEYDERLKMNKKCGSMGAVLAALSLCARAGRPEQFVTVPFVDLSRYAANGTKSPESTLVEKSFVGSSPLQE
jgi:hypothetical protein